VSRRVFLPRIPRWKLATAAVIGVAFYVASVGVGEVLKVDHPVAAKVLGDLLLAASGIALGFSGVGALLERWQEWQLRQRTGGYVLTLLGEARHLAGRLVALTWEPVRPLLGKFRDPSSDRVWELIQDPGKGRHEVWACTCTCKVSSCKECRLERCLRWSRLCGRPSSGAPRTTHTRRVLPPTPCTS
jgi:hypothetical protein